MRRLLLIFALVLFPAAGLAQTKIKVGTVRSTAIGGVVSAQARGYFKDVGLDVDIALIDTSAAFVPALATNELNVVEGGISANLFNGVAQGLPIKIAFDSTSTPINHSLMLRYDLRNEIKSIRDLKGRTVAVNAPNSIALYEVTRILESAGLTINDVQTKVIPFAQMAVAFQTKAIDAGLEITPFTALLPKQELAIAWIDSDTIVKPSPVMISASMFNTDWAKNNPDTAKAFFTALLRGVRDYCDAYHGGGWRPELLRLLVANGVSTSPELLDTIPWPSRSPDGSIPRASLTDVQHWYVTRGLVRTELPLDRLVDESFAEDANRALGPFRLAPAPTSKAGCGK
jgi:NitT/TauT family transport system substrate-binding protein